MTWVTYRKNIADVRKDQLLYVGKARSVNDALQRAFGEHIPTEPFIVEVNGVPALRETWDCFLHAEDVLTVTLVAGALPAAVSTALVVASVLGYAYMSYKLASLPSVATSVGAGVPETPPSFTFAGQKNIQRLNNVIDNVYGRLRWWPAYLCAPYVVYENSLPLLHVKLSLGLGNFALEDVRVNDTSLAAVGGARYTQYDSGEFVANDELYDGVYYAEDLTNKDLLATDEEGHTALGAYSLNPPNTSAKEVLVNFVYPSGLYTITDNNYAEGTATLRVILTEIDDSGTSTGATQTYTFLHRRKTRNVYRVTERCVPSSFPLQKGRYKITVLRTDARDATTGAQDAVRVESAFAVCTSGRSYAVSVLDVVLPGTSLVGTDAAEKINVVATRQLNYPKNGAWQAALATVNPAWIALDILRKEYGASIALSDIDVNYWETLAQEWQQYTFSYRFEQETTVWDALQAIAVATRSQLFRLGSDIRFTPSSAVKQPVALFTPDTAQNLELVFGFKTETENDCIEAAYVDVETGTQDSVFFTPPGSAASNPAKITYAGVTSRQEAWRLAAYEYLTRTVTRDTVRITTGLDGQIPLNGDVVLVSWPFPSWESAGIVNSYEDTNDIAHLSEEVPFSAGWLAFRKADGTTWGPVKYTRLTDTSVQVLSNLDVALDFTGFVGEPVAYTLGDSTTVTKRFQVTAATVSDDDASVQLEAVEFAPSVFSYDNVEAPARGDDMLPYPVATKGVPWVRILDESGQFLRIELGPVFGTPLGVSVHYLFKALADTPDDAFVDPTYYNDELAVAPTAEAVGASYYLERQTGVLFVRVVTTYFAWPAGVRHENKDFRTFVGAFGASASYPVYALLVNNCDEAYVGPGNPGNLPRANGAAQASIRTIAASPLPVAKLDTNDKCLMFNVDCPPDASVFVRVSSTYGAVTKNYTVRTVNGGLLVFSYDALKASGVLDVGNLRAYPTVIVTQWVEGLEALTIPFRVQPRSLTSASASVTATALGYGDFQKFLSYAGSSVHFEERYVTYNRLLSLVGACSGATGFRWTPHFQSSGTSVELNDSAARSTSNPSYTLSSIARPHFTNFSVINTTPTDFIEVRCTPRYGNLNPSTSLHAWDYWRVGVLDANLTQVLPDVQFAITYGDGVKMNTVANDTPDTFLLVVEDSALPSGYRKPSTEEITALSQASMLFAFDEMEFLAATSDPNGWGGATCEQLDMFGFAGDPVDYTVT